MSDTDHSNFATGSPYEPFHVDPVARENYRFLSKSRRPHTGINRIRRFGQAKQPPSFVRLPLTERNDRATRSGSAGVGLVVESG